MNGGNQTLMDKTTNYIAAGAITSPAWLPTLKEVSEAAGLLVPILDAVWLTVQIISHFMRK